MPKRSSNLPRDPNQLAARIVAMSTGRESPDTADPNGEQVHQEEVAAGAKIVAKEKNPAAVALGRQGGMKGGRARAEKLSAASRTEIARKAASTRWKKAVAVL